MEQLFISIAKQIFYDVDGKNKKASYDWASMTYSRSKNTILTAVQCGQIHTEFTQN